jgi:hypothetical protein
VDIVPDFNHDRKIDDTDKTELAAKGPFRFWINDDADVGDEASGDSEVPGHSTASGGNANAVDFIVNGHGDLLDFFPLWLDISSALQLVPPGFGVQYRLRQDDGAVNIVYTDLTKNQAGDYLTKDDAWTYGQFAMKPASDAETIEVTQLGVNLDTSFLNKIKTTPEKGILLVEGRAATSKPLVLEVWQNNQKVLQWEMPLSLSGVENMYRWINLRGLTGGSVNRPTDIRPPANCPDTLCNGKQIAFMHGYNNSEDQARAALSESFKRLYQSGSRAMFTGVLWQGDEHVFMQAAAAAFFHANIINAFEVAPSYAAAVSHLPGQLYVAAHSAGNMVVSSAIKDFGLNPVQYYMIDAAVSVEAYDESAQYPSEMTPPSWVNYTNRLWASEWYRLFNSNDGRRKLTWRNRFGNLPQAINYYSSGEDVLDNNPVNPPQPVVPGIERAWVFGEMVKGCWQMTWLPITQSHGGWGFNNGQIGGYGSNEWTGIAGGYQWRGLYPSEAALITDDALRTNSFFKSFYLADLYTTNGSAVATNFDVKLKLLAEAIPSTSRAAGRNPIPAFGVDRNVDMMARKRTVAPQWPASRPLDANGDGRWLHGDFRDVAYFFNYPLYEDMVARGGFNQ